MGHNARTKAARIPCILLAALMAVICFGSVAVSAASPGIYVATATPHYRNPQTGVIEDSGGENSQVLGQSMTESATYTQALVEVDDAGNTFVTVRLMLMDNIENPTFSVDGGGTVSATVMQEDFTNNTTDYRMQVNSENSIIRCTMYVVPMGRWVIFYITVSNLQPGSADFIPVISVSEQQVVQQAVEETVAAETEAPAEETTAAPAAEETTVAEETTAAPVAEETTAAETVAETVAEETATESAVTEESTEAAGIAEFDASGSEVTTEAEEETEAASDTGFPVGGIVGIVAAAAAVAAILIWRFVFHKKKTS